MKCAILATLAVAASAQYGLADSSVYAPRVYEDRGSRSMYAPRVYEDRGSRSMYAPRVYEGRVAAAPVPSVDNSFEGFESCEAALNDVSARLAAQFALRDAAQARLAELKNQEAEQAEAANVELANLTAERDAMIRALEEARERIVWLEGAAEALTGELAAQEERNTILLDKTLSQQDNIDANKDKIEWLAGTIETLTIQMAYKEEEAAVCFQENAVLQEIISAADIRSAEFQATTSALAYEVANYRTSNQLIQTAYSNLLADFISIDPDAAAKAAVATLNTDTSSAAATLDLLGDLGQQVESSLIDTNARISSRNTQLYAELDTRQQTENVQQAMIANLEQQIAALRGRD